MKKEIILLRAHHLLCSVLFLRKGYSRTFTENMSQVVELLREGIKVYLITSPDTICSHCPNKRKNGACALDQKNEESFHNNVRSLDEKILKKFGFEEKRTYHSDFLFREIEQKISKETYESFCSSCRWFQTGICSFSKYKERLPLFHTHEKIK